MRSNYPIISVYKKNNIKSEVVTQLLYGDTFKKIKKKGSWVKIKNDSDNYIGYIKNRKFPSKHKNTHKICSISASLYSKASDKHKIKNKLSFGSKIKVLEKKGNFYKFENYWIKKKNLKKINFTRKNTFQDINKFLNIKYKWGGKHFNGIDCSGLVQLCLNFNNQFCPRDTKDQIKYFKKKVDLKNIKKNDLIFWKGHVAVAISKKKLIHAYGPFKKTVAMPIHKTLDRLYKTAKLKIISIKKIT